MRKMNSKVQFATKVAISLTLAYLIPFALGWPQASTAATTVMLIASIGSQRESLAKGTLRILGTVVGALIGLLLVGLFAQDRLLYMLSVSVVISFIFYFRNAYQKDPTLLMLTGVMTLMMSNGGDAEGAFLYGIDRAHMTVFGVIIYTLVGTYLFPSKTEQNLQHLLKEVLNTQSQLFRAITASLMMPQQSQPQCKVDNSESLSPLEENENVAETIDELVEKLFTAQTAFEQHYSLVSKECSDVSAYLSEWQLTLHFTQKVSQLLITTSHAHFQQVDSQSFIVDCDGFVSDIECLFEQCQRQLLSDNHDPEYRWQENKVVIDEVALDKAAHLTRGSVLTLGYVLNRLHGHLSKLAETLSCIDSITKTVSFSETPSPPRDSFLWWDAENFKTAIKVFVSYWVASLIWILFNPPGGYSFVIFSTIFVSLLSFLPVHPKAMAFLFSFGFLFAVPAYIFILPQLELGLELAVFLFTYTFVGFYVFKGPITIFFMLGMFVLGIDNVMNYHFGVLLLVITLFYLVVLMLVFAHYFPFSSKAEHLFLVVRHRLFHHLHKLVLIIQSPQSVHLDKLSMALHLKTANVSAKKLKLWAGKVDVNYFSNNSQPALEHYARQCDILVSHVNTFVAAHSNLQNNPLITKLRDDYTDTVIPTILHLFRTGKGDLQTASYFEEAQQQFLNVELEIEHFFQQLNLEQYSRRDIVAFYIFLNLKRNLYQSLVKVKEASEHIDLDNLKMHRF
ncbi:Uncharacterized membrane protein YccC [Vibrio hangzhouensis]|uniref:Uncharacterized membrane protein YccC n=2 Tax=Vibrio hangzhouensis TaxID=462991 RepID=A0A1H5VWD8_9VIBR|nr:Uncharacterized membrane protein YccC [Vibrio hangzhouensis]